MGKGSSKGHTPREAKDNLKSTQLLSVIDAISEGPVEGPVDGLKSVLLNSTPVLDSEGNTNISGVTVVFRAGEQEQTPPEGFESSGSETVLGTEVKYDTPITRTITSANIDRLRFTFGVQALVETTSKGDRNPSEVRLLVQIQRNGGWVTEKDITIKGKTTSQYLASVVVDNLPPRPFNIRMRRMTPDSTTDQLQNKTLWSSYTEIIDVKQCYPNTALVGLSLRQKYQQQLEQLRRDSEQKGTYNTDDYRKAEQALTESLNRQLNENRRYWQQLEVVQGNWKNGVLRAFQDFTVDADNTAGTAEQVFSSAFSNMGNGLATFVTTGKLNFKSFTSSVLSDMAKILAQATMMKSIKGIGSVLGFDLSSLSLNANGGIYQSADLSRYSGTVVNRPTFFAFAKGAGVMGEAGPEAILPLRRGADGKLGVVADIGGSGMAMFAPQYNIEINNDGTNGQIGPAALKVVYDLGKKAAADFMQQQARDGGRLSGAYR
ncbi:phage tail tape measure protein [Escherichia coli]|uniref:phage tail tape measure protein n=1 Tax=Escherichia coli TaxID=562 RepID=UPI000DA535B1|nr:phage tail tape measure protein [Escherichia coli]SRB55933.1 putative tail length tape measure protein from putative prophage [Escherichia coli]